MRKQNFVQGFWLRVALSAFNSTGFLQGWLSKREVRCLQRQVAGKLISHSINGYSVYRPLFKIMIGVGAIAVEMVAFPAQAAVLSNWRYDPVSNQLEVTVPAGTTPRYFILAEPARIVLDLPETEVGAVQLEQTYSGPVRQIRVAQFQPGLTRIVIELSPDAVLAPSQAELQRVETSGTTTQTGDRWVLRPLLRDFPNSTAATPASSAIAQTPQVTPAPPTPLPAATTPPPAATMEESYQPPTASDLTDSDLTERPLPTANAALPTTVPPLEPGAVEIPVEVAPSTPSTSSVPVVPAGGTTQPPVETVDEVPEPEALEPETVIAEIPVAPQAEPSRLADAPPTGASTTPVTSPPSASPLPTSPTPTPPPVSPEPPTSTPQNIPAILPPVTFSTNEPVTVRVPSLGAPTTASSTTASTSTPPENLVTQTDASSAEMLRGSSAAQLPSTLPPALPSVAQPGIVSVPPLQSTSQTVPAPVSSSLPVQSSSTARSNQPVVEFGQPLPQARVTVPTESNALPPVSPSIASAPSPNVLIPSGTRLSLRYPGSEALSLQTGEPRQEVLLLTEALRDFTGNVIAPEGTQVLGRFESGSGGSRFVAQAITLQGYNVLLSAQSEPLGGDRQISERSLVRNSALGALALTVLGGFTGIGLLGGIAAGAATTYVTAPQPATIQPNQVLEVRVIEDIPRPF